MPHSPLEDLESHDRLLNNNDDHPHKEESWDVHNDQSSKRGQLNYGSTIGCISLLLNLILIVSLLCLWVRTRSPLPPWPDTLYCMVL
jgi:hypothetical protein